MTLLGPSNFADIAGISLRAAQIAFRNAAAGRQWHGHVLPVVEIGGQRGGASGKVWALSLDHCSPELRTKLQPTGCDRVEAPAKGGVVEPISDAQIAEQQARLRIIQPILATPKGSPERAAMTRAVAAERHDYPGGAQAFAFDTLRAWVAAFERDGFSGLLPKRRSDRGRRRVLITREWDAGIDLPEERKRAIAAELTLEARSLAANDGTSDRELRLCAFHLARRCEAAGSALAPGRLRALCTLNHKWAKRQGLDRFRLVHMHERDHKAWQDSAVPRIRRALHDMHMGLLIGDVHFVDILVAENREPVRVRLIAWLDASSLFAWVTPVFLSKGKGVWQEDVAEALSQVAFCSHGGIPQEYYLDNGSEYSELAAAMARLANLAEMQFGVTVAKPYSPTSKGEIEGFFNILEGDAFDLIFSRPKTRVARQGMITINGALYHSPRMDDLPVGARLEVLVPLRKGRGRVFLRHEGEDLGWAEMQPVFAHGDRAGARRQGVLEQGRTQAVRRLRAQTVPSVSTFDLQKAAVTQNAPTAGDPEGWTYAIDKTLLPPSPAERDAAEDAERRAFIEDFLAMSGEGERPAAATAGLSGAT